MDSSLKIRTRIGAYAGTVLAVVTWLLALGVAGLGVANRRGVERLAASVMRARALDVALATAGTLGAVRPRSRARLQEALVDVVREGRQVVRAELVGPFGVVLASSRASDVGRRCTGGPPSIAQAWSHKVVRLGRGRYEVWLALPRAGRRWRRWREFWHRMHGHPPGVGPGGGYPSGGPPGGPVGPPPVSPEPPARAPFLHFEIQVEAPEVWAAVRRARSIQLFSLATSGLVLLLSSLVFLAGRRSRKLLARLREQERLAEIGRMGAVLAHEIRNPLGVIKGNAQLAAERLGGGPPELGAVVEQSARLERLVNALLDYARPAEPKKSKVDLARLTASVVEAMTPEAQAKGLLFVTDLEQVTARVDPDQYQQLLLNLIRNALDVSRSTVTVVLKRRSGHAVIQVTDTGPGISPEMEERLFEPFVTDKADGTGLGLAICEKIVQAHGGRIQARSLEGRGARFEVWLPLDGEG